MLDASCIFCKIIQRTIKSTIAYENDHVLVIEDIAPKAPIHYLIIPKQHVDNINTLTPSDDQYVLSMIKAAQELGNKIPSKAFNLISNNGAAAGQSVFHLHMHFLAGKNLYQHGLQL